MLFERTLFFLRRVKARIATYLLIFFQGADLVYKRKHKPIRIYRFVSDSEERPHRSIVICAAVLLAAVFLIGAVSVIRYYSDYFQSKRISAELRADYYSYDELPEQSAMPSAAPSAATASATHHMAEDVMNTPAPTSPARQPTATPALRLSPVRYPNNYYANVRSRFQKLRRQNTDIIGWITIEDLLDEAVVQRDNEYYLRRDYRGYHNSNGAIFLDEHCELTTRPYTLILYGHNMKTGAMFGGLRNYENIIYYKNNPFITFDTAYEDGRFVIVGVASVSTVEGNWRYVDFSALNSLVISQRSSALQALMRRSVFNTSIDVQASDQLLLLVTCTEMDTDRRVVVARRIRADETEEELIKKVRRATEK